MKYKSGDKFAHKHIKHGKVQMPTWTLLYASILWKSDTKTREDIHAKDKGSSKKTTKPNTPNYWKVK